MATNLTDDQKAILDKKAFAFVTTLMPDGSPQTTPVWVDHDGQHVTFNTARGRLKARNLERDPRLSVALVDPDNPYGGVLTVRGRGELVDAGADEHIDRLAKKYLGQDRYPWRQPGDRRVTVRVHAHKVGGGG
jgi:PPOX class probable F420-dependent enzyme